MFKQITKASMGKQIVMFLDYDGTLSPIVDDPDRAFMSDEVRIAWSLIPVTIYDSFVLVSSLLHPTDISNLWKKMTDERCG